MGRGDKQYLYRLTFPDGMVYIGIAFDVERRWANGGVHYRSQKVYPHIAACGWENIKKDVIIHIPIERNGTEIIRKMERELILAYGNRCYNQPQYEIKSYLTVNGETKPTRDWCAEYGISPGKVIRRISRWGLTPIQALTFPSVPNGYNRRPMEYWRKSGCFDKETNRSAVKEATWSN